MAAMQPNTTEEGSQFNKRVLPNEISDDEVIEYIRQNNPSVYEELTNLSNEDQKKALLMMRGNYEEKLQNAEGDY